MDKVGGDGKSEFLRDQYFDECMIFCTKAGKEGKSILGSIVYLRMLAV